MSVILASGNVAYGISLSFAEKLASLNRWSRWFFDVTESDSGVITLSNPQKLS